MLCGEEYSEMTRGQVLLKPGCRKLKARRASVTPHSPPLNFLLSRSVFSLNPRFASYREYCIKLN